MSEQPQPSPQSQPRPPTQPQPQPKPVCWVWDAALGLFLLLWLVLAAILFPIMVYRAGRDRDLDNPLMELSLCAVWAMVLALALFLTFLRILLVWKRASPAGRTVRMVVFILLLGLTCLTFPVGILLGPKPLTRVLLGKEVTFLHGFRDAMRERADLAAIREWAKANPGWKDQWDDKGGGPVLARRPPFLRDLDCSDVEVSEDGTTTRLWFGGGFGHWGLTVGPEDALIPQPDGHLYGLVLPMVPGAFVWEEIQ